MLSMSSGSRRDWHGAEDAAVPLLQALKHDHPAEEAHALASDREDL
jgi:hypothetical protein